MDDIESVESQRGGTSILANIHRRAIERIGGPPDGLGVAGGRPLLTPTPKVYYARTGIADLTTRQMNPAHPAAGPTGRPGRALFHYRADFTPFPPPSTARQIRPFSSSSSFFFKRDKWNGENDKNLMRPSSLLRPSPSGNQMEWALERLSTMFRRRRRHSKSWRVSGTVEKITRRRRGRNEAGVQSKSRG